MKFQSKALLKRAKSNMAWSALGTVTCGDELLHAFAHML
jgi:hypothetical protein